MDLKKASRDPWVWGQLALAAAIGLLAPLLPRQLSLGWLDPVLNRIDPAWARWIGAGVMALGIALGIWSARSLGPALTPGTEPLPGAPLVTTGPYARSRHPIYLGAVLALAGYTLLWSNWTLALVFGLAALKYFEAKARAEERWLLARYPSYDSYMREVPRRVL